VEGGHRAIVFSRLTGIKEEVYAEGMHFVIPGIEWPTIYDVRTRPRNLQSLTGSKDLQMVNITLRVLSKPDSTKLPFIYRRLGLVSYLDYSHSDCARLDCLSNGVTRT
jgi:prohibitin 2